jgi:iron(III) transport system substrate-binding protein
MTDNNGGDDGIVSRRRFLQGSAVAGIASIAGCNAPGGGQRTGTINGTAGDAGTTPAWYGSGPGAFEERPVPGGTSMSEMPDLSGTINVYSGRGQGLVGDLLAFMEERYPDLNLRTTYDSAATLANRISTEGSNTPADVFYSVNAGSLGFLAENGHTQPLREGTTSLVPESFRANDGAWTGTSGRARTVPYNTNTLSESDVPNDIMSFPDLSQYSGEIGWAPTYSSFQAFVTAMRIIEGEESTRQWLQGMQDLGVQRYGDEFAVSQAVADGELAMGFANHYYIQRVLASRPNAPISTGFTQNDAGSIFNVAGACRMQASDRPEMADLLVRHLLSSEAQEYFAIRTFEYPLVEGVDPVGRLPPISELDVPNIDLSQLSDLEETIRLMRDVGVL